MAMGCDASCCQRMGPGQSWQEVAWGQPGCPGGSRSSESARTLQVVPASSLTQGCRCQAALCQVRDQLEMDSEPGWMAEAGGRSLLWSPSQSPAHGRSHMHTQGHLASLGTRNGGISGQAEVAQPWGSCCGVSPSMSRGCHLTCAGPLPALPWVGMQRWAGMHPERRIPHSTASTCCFNGSHRDRDTFNGVWAWSQPGTSSDFPQDTWPGCAATAPTGTAPTIPVPTTAPSAQTGASPLPWGWSSLKGKMRGWWDNGTHRSTPQRGEGMEGCGDMSLWGEGPWRWERKGLEEPGGAHGGTGALESEGRREGTDGWTDGGMEGGMEGHRNEGTDK